LLNYLFIFAQNIIHKYLIMKTIKFSETEIEFLRNHYELELLDAEKYISEIKNILKKLGVIEKEMIQENALKTVSKKRGRPKKEKKAPAVKAEKKAPVAKPEKKALPAKAEKKALPAKVEKKAVPVKNEKAPAAKATVKQTVKPAKKVVKKAPKKVVKKAAPPAKPAAPAPAPAPEAPKTE
jgi:hypothetical protein